jgi:xylulokinase
VTAPRHERVVLAIDLGTGGPKIGLVSLTGKILWSDHVALATRLLPGGGAVQDADAWWHVITAATRRAMASGVVRPEQVAAVSCTGQWASTVPVGIDGRPVGDCVMWMDCRGAPYTRRAVGGLVSGYSPVALWRWVRHSGGAPSTSGADPIGHMLYLEHEEPAVAEQTRWYLEPVDYLSMRFTGVAAATHASMTGAWLTDNRRPDRLSYDSVLVKRAGVPADKLPPLVPTGSVVGEVRAEIADQLGLTGGVVVVTGTPDLHSAVVGSGAVLDYQAHLAISTTSWISCPVPMKKTDAVHQITSVPGVTPGQYLVVNNHDTGGLCLQWLRDNVIAPEDGLLGATSPTSDNVPFDRRPTFDELTALAAPVPAGAGDIVFTPWLAGERSPVADRKARGGFHNLSLETTRAHMVRAVLEGVAYNSRWLHDAVEHFAKRRLDPLRVIGGGAGSDLWCQIHADVMGRTVERVTEPLHANLRGAAMFAARVLGEIDLGEIHDLVEVDSRFEPNAANAATYDKLFGEFPKLYTSQKPMFARLNRHRASPQPSRPY